MLIHTKAIVSYREKIKGSDEFTIILTRVKIIKDVLCSGISRVETAIQHGTCRNTVGNIIKLFRKEIEPSIQSAVVAGKTFTKDELLSKLGGLSHKSRAPKSHSRMATREQEDCVARLHQEAGFGCKRLLTHIKRTIDGADGRFTEVKDARILKGLTEAQVKGVYKRKGLKGKRKRATSQKTVRLYDYDSIGAFEHLHYDTKEVTDMKALPIDVYNKFKNNPELPVREWNIIDACSRFRFIAWSHGLTSEFGFHFLITVIQFIRGSFPWMREMKINIGTDNGSEFCSSSLSKLNEWNRSLSILNAEMYTYEPNFDIRKNLIERSHRTDDEEFLVPKGPLIKDRESFLREARTYATYFNSRRPHSGYGMNNMTPIEKLESRGLKSARKLLKFPTMILEETIGALRRGTEIVQVIPRLKDLLNSGKQMDHKERHDIGAMFKGFFSQPYAQNVLTQNQKDKI
jgi:hypothetical protein